MNLHGEFLLYKSVISFNICNISKPKKENNFTDLDTDTILELVIMIRMPLKDNFSVACNIIINFFHKQVKCSFMPKVRSKVKTMPERQTAVGNYRGYFVTTLIFQNDEIR